jgi:CBS domain containing-hemolysin-like protein
VQRVAVETGFSRFPVRADDRLVGFVHVKDALVGDHHLDEALPARFLHPMPDVDCTMPLPDVLTTLRRTRSHMGNVVRDGRSVGVVALEDVVEEVVGEIVDAAHTA